MCKETIKHGLVLIFLLEVVDKTWFLMILEGELCSLMSILPLSKEEKMLPRNVKMNVNLMFEKFNQIPCEWAIPDAWQ